MKTALMVLNPRQIPECVDALRSLQLDVCWIKNMREPEVAIAINREIERTEYDRFMVVSDDCSPTPEATAAILALHDEGHPVVTGYCNLDAVLPECNLTDNVLPPPPATVDSYHFLNTEEMRRHDGPIVTTFAGLAMTCMSRAMWLRFPMCPLGSGHQVDYSLSYRLQCEGIPIVAPPDGFVLHHKETWNRLDRAHGKRLLIGELPPAVEWELA